jgi:sulfur-oxidizing protein SoxX
MRNHNKLALAAAVIVAAGCAGMGLQADPYEEKATAMLKTSFEPKGQAHLDRLDQDEMQKTCTEYANKPLPKEVARRVEAEQLKLVKLPADGKLMGDWKAGEKIAQTGVGLQYSDDPKNPNGGNCYACHQLSSQEVSFGTIGPSLHGFGKQRGFTPEMQKYVYSKIYDSDAFAACSNMPRFGHNGILTEHQIKDLVSLLMDPASPVNQ